MTKLDLFKGVLRDIQAMHDQKRKDYGTDTDPYANVRAVEEFGIEPWLGAVLKCSDKMSRLKTYTQKGYLTNEGVADSLIDNAVYACIALALWREKQIVADTAQEVPCKTAHPEGEKLVADQPIEVGDPVHQSSSREAYLHPSQKTITADELRNIESDYQITERALRHRIDELSKALTEAKRWNHVHEREKQTLQSAVDGLSAELLKMGQAWTDQTLNVKKLLETNESLRSQLSKATLSIAGWLETQQRDSATGPIDGPSEQQRRWLTSGIQSPDNRRAYFEGWDAAFEYLIELCTKPAKPS